MSGPAFGPRALASAGRLMHCVRCETSWVSVLTPLCLFCGRLGVVGPLRMPPVPRPVVRLADTQLARSIVEQQSAYVTVDADVAPEVSE